MSKWKAAVDVVKSIAPLGLIAAFVIGVLALTGECSNWRERNEVLRTPQVAQPTKLEERSPTVAVPGVTVQGVDPSPKDRAGLEKKYEVDLPPTVPGRVPEIIILGEREIQTLPAGGTILATMDAATGETELTVVANPEKFWQLESAWEIGAVYGYSSSLEERWRAWVAYEPLRGGRFHLRLEAGTEFRAGIQDSYVMAGGVWRSR